MLYIFIYNIHIINNIIQIYLELTPNDINNFSKKQLLSSFIIIDFIPFLKTNDF